MNSLTRCSDCHGFVPSSLAACPNCGAAHERNRSPLATGLIAAGGGLAMLALSACYGPGAASNQLCTLPDGGEELCYELTCVETDAGYVCPTCTGGADGGLVCEYVIPDGGAVSTDAGS